MGRAREKIRDRDYEPGRAEPALDGAGVDKRLLDGVERRGVRGEALDGDDVVPLRLCRQDEARSDEGAVEEHGARAALALLTSVL